MKDRSPEATRVEAIIAGRIEGLYRSMKDSNRAALTERVLELQALAGELEDEGLSNSAPTRTEALAWSKAGPTEPDGLLVGDPTSATDHGVRMGCYCARCIEGRKKIGDEMRAAERATSEATAPCAGCRAYGHTTACLACAMLVPSSQLAQERANEATPARDWRALADAWLNTAPGYVPEAIRISLTAYLEKTFGSDLRPDYPTARVAELVQVLKDDLIPIVEMSPEADNPGEDLYLVLRHVRSLVEMVEASQKRSDGNG